MKKYKWHYLFFICLAVFLSSIGYRQYEKHQIEEQSEIYDKLSDIVHQNATESEDITAALIPNTSVVHTMENDEFESESETEDTMPPYEKLDIDFEQLWQINSDICAWIDIPNTKISYPVLQDPYNDLYYLDHTVDKKEGYPGSLYIERINDKYFQDKNTIIYGHNMRDGSMFGTLSSYMDRKYLNNHRYIYVYVPQKETEESENEGESEGETESGTPSNGSCDLLQYEVFAAVTYDDRHILQTYDFEKENEYQQFLDSIRNIRNMETYINQDMIETITPEDRILTLSTCVGGNRSDLRFIVEAVWINDEEEAEDTFLSE